MTDVGRRLIPFACVARPVITALSNTVFLAIQTKRVKMKITTCSLISVILLISACYTGCNVPKHVNENLSDAEAIRVAANGLIFEYLQDESTTNEKYKGKVLLVDGKFESMIDASRPIVYLKETHKSVRVQCEFNNKNDQLKRLREDDDVLIKGRCTGISELLNVITLEHCVIVERTM